MFWPSFAQAASGIFRAPHSNDEEILFGYAPAPIPFKVIEIIMTGCYCIKAGGGINDQAMKRAGTSKERSVMDKAESAILREGMIDKGDAVVVAVSGGPDSVCLFDVLYRLKDGLEINLVIAHFNHLLRPGEDEEETRFMQSMAREYDIPLETDEWREGPQPGGGSKEEQARKARYAFLESIRKRYAARRIAVGHNLNDQAETVLMRLLRGSGPMGLSGMHPIREGIVIRPLLNIKRDEIIAYLQSVGLRYMIDSSNRSQLYLRNRIRLEVIPALNHVQPGVISALSRLAGIMREDESYLAGEALRLFKWLKKEKKDGAIELKTKDFDSIHPAIRGRLFRHAVAAVKGDLLRIGAIHIRALENLLADAGPSAYVRLPDGIIVRRQYDLIVFERKGEGPSRLTEILIPGPGRYKMQNPPRVIVVEEFEGVAFDGNRAEPSEAYLDAGLITYPLKVRAFRPGDRFIPMGMDQPKKLKEFFIDRKVPRMERPFVPILTCGGEIVWICGMRPDNRFRITEKTIKIIRVCLSSE